MSEFPIIDAESHEPDVYQRISDIADVYSEPCLLLAEHIASEADQIRLSNYKSGNTKTRVYSSETLKEETLDLHTIVISDEVYDPDNRVTALELGWFRKQFRVKSGLFTKANRWGDDMDRPMLLLALAHGVRVPVMQIWPIPSGDCSFVTFEKGLLSSDEVIVTHEDVDEERRQVLSATYEALKQYQNDQESKYTVDLVNMNVFSRVIEVMGYPDEDLDFILSSIIDFTGSGVAGGYLKIGCTVRSREVEFPAMLFLSSIRRGSTIELSVKQKMHGSQSFGEREYLPKVYITPASKMPVQFEGVVDDQIHQKLLLVLRDLLLLLPQRE